MFYIFLFFFFFDNPLGASKIEIEEGNDFYINDPKYYEGIKYPLVINNYEQDLKLKQSQGQQLQSQSTQIIAQNISTNSSTTKIDAPAVVASDSLAKKNVTLDLNQANIDDAVKDGDSLNPFAKFENYQEPEKIKLNIKGAANDDVVQKNNTNSNLNSSEDLSEVQFSNQNDLLDGLLYDKKMNDSSLKSVKSEKIDIKKENTDLQEEDKVKKYRISDLKGKYEIEKVLRKIASAKNKKEESRLTEKLQNLLNRKIQDNNPESAIKYNDRSISVRNPNLVGSVSGDGNSNNILSFEKEAFADQDELTIFKNTSVKSKLEKVNSKKLKNNITQRIKIDQAEGQENIKKYYSGLDNKDNKPVISKNELTDNFFDFNKMDIIPARKSYKKNTKRQILPPNIAKATKTAYLLNNQHLDTVVFKESLMRNAFLSIDSEDNVRIISEIINQTQSPNMQDQDGNTLLHHAVAKKKYSLVRFLIQSGCDPNIKNKSGFMPLHLASSYGDYNSIYYLLAGGADPNKKDQDGNTSFMYAVSTGDRDVAKLMVSFGVKLSEKNNLGKNAINIAQESNNISVLTYLASIEDRFTR